jgi:hypothetical protein
MLRATAFLCVVALPIVVPALAKDDSVEKCGQEFKGKIAKSC